MSSPWDVTAIFIVISFLHSIALFSQLDGAAINDTAACKIGYSFTHRHSFAFEKAFRMPQWPALT
jgi:hypothetical protein